MTIDWALKTLSDICFIVLATAGAFFVVESVKTIHGDMLRIENAVWTINCQAQGLTPAMCEFMRKEAAK